MTSATLTFHGGSMHLLNPGKGEFQVLVISPRLIDYLLPMFPSLVGNFTFSDVRLLARVSKQTQWLQTIIYILKLCMLASLMKLDNKLPERRELQLIKRLYKI